MCLWETIRVPAGGFDGGGRIGKSTRRPRRNSARSSLRPRNNNIIIQKNFSIRRNPPYSIAGSNSSEIDLDVFETEPLLNGYKNIYIE